jgi:hypothetical protein
MLNRGVGSALGMTIFLAAGALALAAGTTVERFTFTTASAPTGGSPEQGRTELVVTRWSDEAERERVLNAAAEGTPQLGRAIAAGWDAGYLRLPGNLHYTLRYAHRASRADGGEDVVVATDKPIWWWWDPARSAEATKQDFTIIQLRLNKEGEGEGKVSAVTSTIGSNKQTKTILLDDYTNQPALLTGVRRQRG